METTEAATEEKKKRVKPLWYRQTIRRFTTYTQDKLRLQILIEQLEHEFPSNTAQISLSPGRSIGMTGDQTGSYANRRVELETEIRELRHKIHEVDMILGSLGKTERALIDLKYMQRFNKDFWIAGEIGMAVRSYYRLKDELIILAAQMFGYVKREQISFEELGW
ncbi:hypothetical protein [Desulfosporosinus youngiae]|uniref:Phage transcriptional regulator, RinA family n=1 Tax=Desulfosporosinus youngiae DSM 17734 TaxID=768710 RepID=H5Y289_9FIRM|nr:hypothetical protein [Desulfosporosinus youngiae]EHQ88437.1 hypothetical protein DesyoDRAFT_1269 [Desulfosporosinus youngiae DSM 17734]